MYGDMYYVVLTRPYSCPQYFTLLHATAGVQTTTGLRTHAFIALGEFHYFFVVALEV